MFARIKHYFNRSHASRGKARTDPTSPAGRRFRQRNVPPRLGVALAVLTILAYFTLPLSIELPDRAARVLYLGFTASLGSLIGCALSKNSGRGLSWGAIAGLLLGELLRLSFF